MLDGQSQWCAAPQEEIPGTPGFAIRTRIEIDAESIVDGRSVPIGAVVQKGAQLTLKCREDRGPMTKTIVLESGLDDCGEASLGFLSGHLVTGEGDDLKVLWASEAKK